MLPQKTLNVDFKKTETRKSKKIINKKNYLCFKDLEKFFLVKYFRKEKDISLAEKIKFQ